MEEVDQFLPEKRRHDLLGRAGSSKCLAVSSTDTGPALMALGPGFRLVSRSGEREVALADLYNNGWHRLHQAQTG